MALVRPLAVLMLPLLVSAATVAAPPEGTGRPSEYAVKAAFLYNFAKFVEWPPAGRPPGPFVVAVLGEDPFGTILEQTFSGKAVVDRTLVVRRAATLEEVKDADILFIASSEASRLPHILSTVEGKPILTVAEIDDFAGRGGMVAFRLEDDLVRFDVNLERVGKAQLKMSSQLLRVARRVFSAGGS